MARISGIATINQRIDELNGQINHFEECIRSAKQDITTLQQALIALESEPFSLPVKQFDKYQSKASLNSSERIAKVFKHFPNQWLSTREIMLRVFEIEGKSPDKSAVHSILITFSHALRRLLKQGIVERQRLMGTSGQLIQWRLKEIE